MEQSKKDRTRIKRITRINMDNYSIEELECADRCSGSPLDSSRGQMEYPSPPHANRFNGFSLE